jgi:hypothetical protein
MAIFIGENISEIILLTPGADVMITIVCSFCQFSKIGVFLNYVMIQFLQKLALV